MLKVVIDTNIFISALITKQGKPAELIQALKDRKFVLFISQEIIDEVTAVIQRPKIQKFICTDDYKRMLKTIYKYSFMTQGIIQVSIVSDPKDNMFISCCEESEADYLISGDNDLLTLKSYKKTDIITVEAFLKILNRC